MPEFYPYIIGSTVGFPSIWAGFSRSVRSILRGSPGFPGTFVTRKCLPDTTFGTPHLIEEG